MVTRRTRARRRSACRKACAIENQQAFAFGNHRAQATPDGVGVPRRIGDDVLEGLVRSGLDHPRQHRFHRFAGAVAQQPLDVPPQGEHLRAIYRDAWEQNWGFVAPTEAEFQRLASELKPIFDPRCAVCAEVDGPVE